VGDVVAVALADAAVCGELERGRFAMNAATPVTMRAEMSTPTVTF
jgi:hypothetical protein